MKIEWNPLKAKLNIKKHGITFEEAATAISDPMAVTGSDPDHSIHEERYITVTVEQLALTSLPKTHSSRRVTRAADFDRWAQTT